MQRPMLDITCSNWYQAPSPVNTVKSHFIQSARDNIPELYDLHRFQSAADHFEFIDFLLADNKDLCADEEPVEGGVSAQNPTQRVSKAAKEWPESTLLSGRSNPAVLQSIILSSGE